MTARPSFASTVAALMVTDSRFPWVGPSPEEADVAAALEELERTHQPDADQPDHYGRWGRCTCCREPWPCPRWVDGEHLAVQFLGRAADRVMTHARPVLNDLAARERRTA
jgi:hypothetical protein